MPRGRLLRIDLRDGVHLRDRAADVSARLEINLEDADAVDRFGFDMLDAVDGGRVGALGNENHPALDVEGGKARIVPDDHDDRKIDRREDIHVHQAERKDAEDEHQERHHRDGERAAKREADNPHKVR